MSPARAKKEFTSTDFVEGCVYIQEEVNHFHREDWFMAAIVAEIRRIFAKDPNSIKVEDHVLKFKPEEKKPELTKHQQEAQNEVARQHKLAMSKAFWFGLAGVKPRLPPDPKKVKQHIEPRIVVPVQRGINPPKVKPKRAR